MVMKTFIAASFAALFAGGVVYYGTEPADGGGEGVIVNDEAIEDTRSSKDIISRYISEDEVKGDEYVEADDLDNPYELEGERAEFASAEEHPHPPKNQKDSEEEAEASELEVTEPEVIETGTIELIEPEQIIPPEEVEMVEAEELVEEELDLSPVSEIRPPREEEVFVEPPRQVEMTKPEETQSKPVKRPHRSVISGHVVDKDDPAMKRIRVVFKEAENITQPDLRDRAYLDLADYATNKGMFKQAERAALKIKQIELRDTARSRIAMGLARFGHSDDAFALIEQVEVEELRDVMRLQVIEALLGTDGRR